MTKDVYLSNCCNANTIEPEDDLEQYGSMWRAYACYICKSCGHACDVHVNPESTPFDDCEPHKIASYDHHPPQARKDNS